MKPLRSPKDESGRSILRSVFCLATQEDLLQMECRLLEALGTVAGSLGLEIHKVMLTQLELEQGLNTLTAQQGKIAAEQAAKSNALQKTIEELQAQILAGPVSVGVETAFGSLKIAAQALDDVIPDPPAA